MRDHVVAQKVLDAICCACTATTITLPKQTSSPFHDGHPRKCLPVAGLTQARGVGLNQCAFLAEGHTTEQARLHKESKVLFANKAGHENIRPRRHILYRCTTALAIYQISWMTAHVSH